jgi:hypothetical protein
MVVHFQSKQLYPIANHSAQIFGFMEPKTGTDIGVSWVRKVLSLRTNWRYKEELNVKVVILTILHNLQKNFKLDNIFVELPRQSP